jgi:two-component system cell cycle response regulator DivK
MRLAHPRRVRPEFPSPSRRVEANASDRGAGSTGSGVMQRPWRVLIVDDDEDGRELCAEYLAGAGFEVLLAENGEVGIETAVRRRPDIVVMDLEMPVMGGLEAIERLRGDARTRAIPIVVLSANGDVDCERVRLAGCDTCLVKPCLPDDLEGVVRALLDADRLQPASRDSASG